MSESGTNKRGGKSTSRPGNRSAGHVKGAKFQGGAAKENFRKPKDDSRKPKENGWKPKDDSRKPKENFRKPKDDSGKPKENFRKPKDDSRKPREFKGNSAENLVRLNKYIAASGVCSRREADQLIAAGLVKVNGRTVTELGTKVSHHDDVRYNGERMRNERKVYLVLNKPKDFVTTTDDPRERKTVMSLVKNACPERIYPVGRLDRNTTGVLMFTNDGEMAKRLTHPGHNKKKVYHVFLEKAFTAADMKKLTDGITLEDGLIQADAISYVSSEHKREVGLEIHSGRNRIVRRMFESLGYKVTKLDRVYFAGLTKKNLPRGKWRFLTDQEINRLKMNAYE